VTGGTRTKLAIDRSKGATARDELLEEKLLELSPAGNVSSAERCVSRTILPNGIGASCAEHAQPPIAIKKLNIVPNTLMLSPSSLNLLLVEVST
jgi:hypothetical protein